MIVKTCLQPPGNFGDSAINSYLVEKITGHKPQLVSISNRFNHMTNYIISGSILASTDEKSIVWGAGFLGKEDKVRAKPKRVFAVRGKLTRQKLLDQGVECPEVYGDPALLMPRFYKPDVTRGSKVGLVPHYIDMEYARNISKEQGYKLIKICSGVENVIDEIYACDFILSSSLHGLIIADAYGIPACWIKLSNNLKGNDFKFVDYYSTRKNVDLDKLWEACPFK